MPVGTLGYVRVTDVAPLYSRIESIDYQGLRRLPDLEQIPPFSRCTIVRRELGDLRMSLALALMDRRRPEHETDRATLSAAVSQLSERLSSQIRIEQHEKNADWVLRFADAQQAVQDWGSEAPEACLLLVAGHSQTSAPISALNDGPEGGRLTQRHQRIYARYSLADRDQLADQLEADFRKIFRWQTLWCLAGNVPQRLTDDQGLRLDVFATEPYDRAGTGKPRSPAAHILTSGDLIEVRLSNMSDEDMWVTLFYLDANFAVHIWLAEAVKSRRSLEPIVVQVDDESLGAEGLLVLAAPIRQFGNMPDYGFLEQSGLGMEQRSVDKRYAPPATPFQRLMHSLRDTSTVWQRSHVTDDPFNPQVLSWTWVSQGAVKAGTQYK